MPFLTADQFSRRHGGLDGLTKFIEMIQQGCADCRNRRKRCKLKHIAEEFGLSTSEVCQLRKKLMRQVWEPHEGLVNYLELQRWSAHEEFKETEAVILRLQHGQTSR